MSGTWRAYYPEDGETVEDAREIAPRWAWQKPFADAEDAACRACEMDYSERDGWERDQDSEFPIIVIAPDGTESRWAARHEMSIEHRVNEVEDE